MARAEVLHDWCHGTHAIQAIRLQLSQKTHNPGGRPRRRPCHMELCKMLAFVTPERCGDYGKDSEIASENQIGQGVL